LEEAFESPRPSDAAVEKIVGLMETGGCSNPASAAVDNDVRRAANSDDAVRL
jgi:uncharacterized protein YoaH (UPF0181 family)